MTLFEVNQKYLKYQNENETYRFIHDPFQKISIHIWQKKQPSSDGTNEITRFQVALDDDILEWKDSHVRYGEVDSGETEMGIKRTPVMMMTEVVNQSFIEKIVPVLKENENIAGMRFIIQIIENSGQSEKL
ncbi:MAG: hypothetical protein OEV78_10040 [Spirochaetia bacterium]|nr:hypothetical protein [Spirochaetia bacterium]